jgi:hypothetical protein
MKLIAAAHESVNGTKRTLGDVRCLVANGGKADMAIVQSDFRVWPEPDIDAPKDI